MNLRLLSFSAAIGCALVLPAATFAARATSDLPPPQKRQTAVTTAERLTQRKALPPLPADLVSPFSPPDFDKPDATEASANPAPAPKPGTPAPSTPTPAAPASDLQTLETLAAQITPTGVIQMGGSPRLVIGAKRFEVGTRFTATYNGRDYELELVAIDRTTFTLRYRGEETTRPIKLVR
jgi:hypothetical protein